MNSFLQSILLSRQCNEQRIQRVKDSLQFLYRHKLQVSYDSNRNKHTIDYSRVPKLEEEDLEEMFVKGSGPGGQAVNKTNNCVVLAHKPTGLVVRCHQSRLQSENRQQARRMLVSKLDNLFNGQHSVEAQLQEAALKKGVEKIRRQRKMQKLKEEWKAREGIE